MLISNCQLQDIKVNKKWTLSHRYNMVKQISFPVNKTHNILVFICVFTELKPIPLSLIETKFYTRNIPV